MMLTDQLMAIISDIYEAAYRPEHWVKALSGIADITGSRSAAMVYRDNELEKASVAYTHNFNPEALRQYNNTFGKLDPFFRLSAEAAPTGVAAAVHQMVPDRQELIEICGEFYTDFMLPFDMFHVCGAHIFNDSKRSAAITIQRGEASGPWDDELIQHVTDLTPHIQRALTIHKEFTRLRMQETAMHAGLDRLLIGLILFDEFLQPVYINPVAASILKWHPAIRMQHDQIYAAQLEDTEKIRQGIIKAHNNHAGDSQEDSTALGLRHPDSSVPLPILITPIRSVGIGLKQGPLNDHVALFISDPESNQPIMPDVLCEAYGLTPAESEVSIAIANGYSVDDIAKLHGTAASTIRSQIKAIFNKLGVNKQTELVKMLLTSPFRGRLK